MSERLIGRPCPELAGVSLLDLLENMKPGMKLEAVRQPTAPPLPPPPSWVSWELEETGYDSVNGPEYAVTIDIEKGLGAVVGLDLEDARTLIKQLEKAVEDAEEAYEDNVRDW